MKDVWDVPTACVCDITVCVCGPDEKVVRNVMTGRIAFTPEQRKVLIASLKQPEYKLFVLYDELHYMDDLYLASTAIFAWKCFAEKIRKSLSSSAE